MRLGRRPARSGYRDEFAGLFGQSGFRLVSVNSNVDPALSHRGLTRDPGMTVELSSRCLPLLLGDGSCKHEGIYR